MTDLSDLIPDLDLDEVCDIFGVTRKHILELARRGDFPPVMKLGRDRYRMWRRDFEKYLDSCWVGKKPRRPVFRKGASSSDQLQRVDAM